ncbi:MAG: hypothetical protein ABSF84_13650 [Acidimicrobiales bacterium]|jgi:hypothetical protein
MRPTSSRVRRGLLFVLVLAAVGSVVVRLRGEVSHRTGVLPTIGGDTWPPVPVKQSGPD